MTDPVTRALWLCLALVWGYVLVAGAQDDVPPAADCSLEAVRLGDTCVLELDDGWLEVRLHRGRLGVWRYAR